MVLYIIIYYYTSSPVITFEFHSRTTIARYSSPFYQDYFSYGMLFQIREETFVIEHFLLCDSSRGNRKPNFLRPFPATKQSSAERAFKRPKNGSSKSTNISIAFKEHLTDTKDSDLDDQLFQNQCIKFTTHLLVIMTLCTQNERREQE